MPVETPAFHQQLMRRVQACLARQSVDADSKVVVETLLREALLYNVSATENANCWVELGDFLFEMGDKQQALEAYKKAINIHAEQEHAGTAGVIQLRTYYRAGLLFLELGNYSDAQSIFLTGCAEHQSALLWLGVGVSFLRQEMWNDAEKAIMEVNSQIRSTAAVDRQFASRVSFDRQATSTTRIRKSGAFLPCCVFARRRTEKTRHSEASLKRSDSS
jgi:tetratricopeptide (TPR) repeat protein